VRCPISTLCLGLAASMASVLLCAGTPGRRFALPNARILIHQPLGGVRGQATDIEIHAKEILHLRAKLNEIYVKHTKQPVEKIRHDTERDFYMGPEEGKAYGIIDEVVSHRKESPKTK
jgi:ATP-dependent Clp protease protease subunit